MKTTLVSIIIMSFLFSESNVHEVYQIDDFSAGMTASWKGRYKDYKQHYTIKNEGENAYLSAKAHKDDCFIIKKIDVDIAEYPFINWRWRVNKLPVEGDESRKDKCDVAASVALVFNKSKLFPKSIKYSWSSTLETGTFTKSPYAVWPGRCDIHVVDSGDENLGEWQEVKINVLEDYKRFYNKNKVKSKRIHAILIMTDSDNTMTPSEADYDDIYFSKT